MLVLLGNGTYVNWAAAAGIFKVTYQQATICNCEAGWGEPYARKCKITHLSPDLPI